RPRTPMPTPINSSGITFGGVDPGAHGAIGLLGLWVSVHDMPRSAAEIVAFFRSFVQPVYFVIEAPQPIPHQKARSIATFWQHVGFLEGVMLTLNIPFQEARPQDWRRAMGCRVKGTAEAKKWSRTQAGILYPNVDLGHREDEGRSDSLILATYAKKLYEELQHGQRGKESPPHPAPVPLP